MSPAELRLLERTTTTVDIETAGRAYDIGRAKAYRLAKAGEFPVPVLIIGRRYRVRTRLLVADILGTPAQEEVGPGVATGTD